MKGRFSVALDMQCEADTPEDYMLKAQLLESMLVQLIQSPVVYTNADCVDADYHIWMDTTLQAKVLFDVSGEDKVLLEKAPFIEALKMEFPNVKCVKRKLPPIP